MKLFFTALLASIGATTANPFAPKTTPSTRRAAYNAKLMRGATPIRRLEDAYDGEVEVNLSSYSIKFEKCQMVKQYSGEGGNNGGEGDNENDNKNGIDTILTTKRFVIFRLCPSGCDSCNYNYGEYIIDMDTYLETTLDFLQEKQENYCDSCNECYQKQANGGVDDDGYAAMCGSIDTSSCYDECQNIENMEDNGYLDASEFTGCVKLGEGEDGDNGQNQRYYAGAMCASSGSRIKIGVFTDDQCSQYVEDGDVETYMSMYANNNGELLGRILSLLPLLISPFTHGFFLALRIHWQPP